MFIRPNAEIKHEYAEAELLEAIRGEWPSGDFTMTITRMGATWVVSAAQVTVSGSRTTGTGESFAEAWLRQDEGPVAAIGER